MHNGQMRMRIMAVDALEYDEVYRVVAITLC